MPALRSYSAYYQNQDFLQSCRASVLPGNCQSQFCDILLVLWPWLAGEERLHRGMHDQHSRQSQGQRRLCLGHLKSSWTWFSLVPGQSWNHRAGYRGQIQAKTGVQASQGYSQPYSPDLKLHGLSGADVETAAPPRPKWLP